MSFCKDCISGVRHEGTAEGTYEEINGIKTYVTTPKTDYPKDKVVIHLTDVFGHELLNNRARYPFHPKPILPANKRAQLLADDFARNGFKVYVPELFEGDPVPEDAFDPDSNFDLMKWLPNHTPEHTGKRVRKVIDGLKEQGINVYGATGYCYGARLLFDLAFENLIQAGAVAHPAFIKEEDFDIYIAKSKAPLLINTCELDEMFPPPMIETADKKFAGFAPGYRRVHFEGVHHGFATRGDLNDATVKAAKEGAFKATAEWLIKYLQ